MSSRPSSPSPSASASPPGQPQPSESYLKIPPPQASSLSPPTIFVPQTPAPKALTLAVVLSGDPDDDVDDEAPDTISQPPQAAKDASLTIGKALSSASAGNDGKQRRKPRQRWRVFLRPEFLLKEEICDVKLGLRISAAALCAVSFSVMAVNTVPGWDGDSFSRYDMYWYAFAANVAVFVYSVYQIIAEVHRRSTGKFLMAPQPWGLHFNVAMDQILAYLLLSASSAAATQNDIWMSRFNGDHFTQLINTSASMSFLAFSVLAVSAIASAYTAFGSPDA